jgi:chromosome segregation ATPase
MSVPADRERIEATCGQFFQADVAAERVPHDAELVALRDQLSALTEALTAAQAYLARLLTHHAPTCEPLPDLDGLCSQIDNLLTGRVEALTACQQERAIAEMAAAQWREQLAAVKFEIASLRAALTACRAQGEAMRAPLAVALTTKEMEAECDKLNFPDKSEYGRFWSRWIEQTRTALSSTPKEPAHGN